LLRQLGIATQPETDSPLQAGIAAIETTLARIGVDPAGFDLADGSGLSRHNLVTPEAIVQTLQAMAASSAYRNSLAVAGESGTLINRFQGTIVQGRLQGKTGALSGVAALSGYLDPPIYEPIAFSILVNHFDVPVREVRPAIDAIVLQLAELQACSSQNDSSYSMNQSQP
ncbi:MAG: D-alanyl-D-alanine carboxypeptidase/D-alanyl-D-alanine-endopeptidase, partial [Microcoleus sp. SIO2G3]|nr:D-alanyl-D-alanine carboxypeptidase/D-alanyl-D-alanine-endopeptidase [Microcoleus sp. SIO2G3]